MHTLTVHLTYTPRLCGGCGATQEAKDQGRKYKALLDKWNRQPSQINKPQRTGWTKVNPNYRPCLWGSDPKDWCMSFPAHAPFLLLLLFLFLLLLLLFYLVCLQWLLIVSLSSPPNVCVCVCCSPHLLLLRRPVHAPGALLLPPPPLLPRHL